MSELEKYLQDIIAENGPMNVGTFMALCLGHPEHGYYMTRQPFGAQGDFTTAPEISQLFGEILGVWVMQQAQTTKYDTLQLVELGPGRGTLMADIWRSLSALPELQKKLQIHLVEFSPRLRALQAEKLQVLPVTWHTEFETIPQRASIILANEFLDALPVEQAVFHAGQWRQRQIITDQNDFIFTAGPALQGIHVQNAKENDLFEYSPAIATMMEDIYYFLRKNGGALCAIDYGDIVPVNERIGETLQALHKHAPCPVLSQAGECDITAHVSFDALYHLALENGCDAHVTTQREFLTQHGIRLRSEKLLAKANLDQARQIKSGLERLIAPDQMGDLFKVMVVSGS